MEGSSYSMDGNHMIEMPKQLDEDGPLASPSATDDAKSSAAPTASIRGSILRRILPVVIIPVIALGALAIVGAIFIQQRTSDAISSAEEILNQEVVAEGANRSADASSRSIANLVDDIVSRAEDVVEDEDFQRITSELIDAPDGFLRARSDFAIRGAEADIQFTNEEVLQVILVGPDGRRLGGPSETLPDSYADEAWFQSAAEDGASFRSFVNDNEFQNTLGTPEPAFEFALRVDPPQEFSIPTDGANGSSVMRVRIPISKIQSLLDVIAEENDVTASIVDSSAALLIADTNSNHDPTILFDTTQLLDEDLGLNTEMLVEAMTVEDNIAETAAVIGEDVISSVRRVGDLQDNASGIQFNWLVQTNQSTEIAAGSLAELNEVNDDLREQRGLAIIAVGFALVLALFFAFVTIRVVATGITAPVQALSEQARIAAEDGIPSVVEAARTSEQLPDLPDFEVESNDELAQLAASLNTMQGAAVDLAAGQAKLRRQNVARTFVSLGRRNQNLLNRQLEFIDELERQESDPDTLENLFRLDHLATRMRRNAENLLVLAGEQTPRRWGKPIAVRDVIRAASAEIADYRRVKLGDIDVATVSGNFATDLSHLVAEILENAGSFSPPTTSIEVLGQQTTTHYRLAIVDHGIGMDERALNEANERLKNPVDFADAPSAYLGLFVVGRLAQDLGITVRLANADPSGEGKRRGTIAFIDIPVTLLSSESAKPIEVDNRAAASASGSAATESPTVEAPAAVSTPEPAAAASPAATPAPAIATEAAPVGLTDAGFPQRRSRKDASGPAQAPAVESAPIAESAAAAPAAAAPPSAAPIAPPTEVTAAGFPKRRSKSDSAAPQPTQAPQPGEPAPDGPRRDAAAISDSLRSFRAAVARGRETGKTEQFEAPTRPGSATTPAPAAQTPVPEQTAPTTPAPAQPPAQGVVPPPVPAAPQTPAMPVATAMPQPPTQPATPGLANTTPPPVPTAGPTGTPTTAQPVGTRPVAEAAPTAAPQVAQPEIRENPPVATVPHEPDAAGLETNTTSGSES